ncbi:MAG: response regulator transcription factor [Ignavibacteriales bacterium]|nr:response regulator transcription factor [Ignavibacteriales bacterium]
MPIRIAIVEDNDKIRDGLEVLLNGSPEFSCVATYGTAEEALKYLPAKKPDVVLMDIGLPRMSGIECVEKLKQILPEIQVMMLTVYEDDDRVFKSLVAGATGYVLKNTMPAQLFEAIRDLHNGGSPMSNVIGRKVVQAFQQMGSSSKDLENLSERENEILSYVAKGYRDKEVADKFFISPDTVRKHLRNIYQKLHVRSRTEAVLKFLQK